MNLKSVIEKQKCRKGTITGTSKDGRFWLACDPFIIKDSGNGWDAPEVTFALHLRHFENGKVEAVVRLKSRCNRNNLSWEHDFIIQGLLECKSLEDVVVELKKGVKSIELDDERSRQQCFNEYYYMNLVNALTNLGLSESRPGPDDDDVVCSIM